MGLILIYDTETTGKWHRDLALDHDAQPNLVQLAAILCDEEGKELAVLSTVIRPEGWVIPHEAAAIHGISDHRARAQGVPLISALALFSGMCSNAEVVIGHNLSFDVNMIYRSYHQIHRKDRLPRHKVCTMLMSKDTLKLPSKYPHSRDPYKFPTLDELHRWCFGQGFEKAHTAIADASATKACYFDLLKKGLPPVPPRISFIPAGTKTGYAQAMNTEHRTLGYLTTILNEVPFDKLTDWDKTFITDHKARVPDHKDPPMLSAKQWSHIERLANTYNIVPKKGTSSDVPPKHENSIRTPGDGENNTSA